MTENKMTMRIYDKVMDGAKSLTSIGLHTGLGRFDRKRGRVTRQLMVPHPTEHKTSNYFTYFSANNPYRVHGRFLHSTVPSSGTGFVLRARGQC